MIAASAFLRKQISPKDMLDGVRETSGRHCMAACSLHPDWVNAKTYLSWAQEGIQLGTNFGRNAAVSFAKQAVCRVIDQLIIHRHLRPVFPSNYPTKIKTLQEAGLRILPIVYDFVIDVRNLQEHNYRQVNREDAEHSVQIAQLFLETMKEEPAIVAFGKDLFSIFPDYPKDIIELGRGSFSPSCFPVEPFVFIDIFEEPLTIKLLISKDGEILTTSLKEFTREQIINLWNLINRGVVFSEGPSFAIAGQSKFSTSFRTSGASRGTELCTMTRDNLAKFKELFDL